MTSFARTAFRYSMAVSLALVSVVLHAQNDTRGAKADPAPAAKPPKSHLASVENADAFPSTTEARQQWAADGDGGRSPAPTPVRTAAPAANSVTAAPLPNPKIDYVGQSLDSIAPMTGAEIKRFQSSIYERSSAGSQVPGGPFKTQTRQIIVDTSPGVAPVTIHVAIGQGCAVTLIDRTGAPLLIDGIQAFSATFAAKVLATERAETEGTNIFTVEARQLTGGGNIIVQLIGQTSPISFNVEVGRSPIVDSQLNLVLPFTSSKRTFSAGERIGAINDAQLPGDDVQSFLAGIPPEGAQDVTVKNRRDVMAWVYKSRLYLRTRLMPISPGYFSKFAATDGTAVYELPMVPVVTLTGDGREVEAELSFPVIPSYAVKSTANR